MRYFKFDNNVKGFDDDIDVSEWIDLSLWYELFGDDVERIENPEKFLTADEKLLIVRQNMPVLSPIEFDLRLDQYDLYDAVHDLIASNRQLKIAYSRATYFSRTDPFIETARIELGLTDEKIDLMWEQALQL